MGYDNLSILLESYCNFRIACFWSELAALSILLESYCNPSSSLLSVVSPSPFNSPRVLLQLETALAELHPNLVFQFS
ncbi:hypothetical protein BD01_0212 [Thermococcus nautili]|uniref:Uncharacterized protein n=1 Tax=Thermococcus nautili TaxID=195522 RepID=W8NZH0_9EURY|nr:hypothetical protein BD01_0212 [Thermococcus nautili]